MSGTQLSVSHYSTSFDPYKNPTRWGLLSQMEKLRVREVTSLQSYPLHTSYRGLLQRRKEPIKSNNQHSNPKGNMVTGSKQRWELSTASPSPVSSRSWRWPPGLRLAGSQALGFSSHIPFLRSSQKLCSSASQVIKSDPGIQPPQYFTAP